MYGKKVKLRLTFLTVLILSLGLTIYLVLVSLKENVVYFLSPTEIKALSELKIASTVPAKIDELLNLVETGPQIILPEKAQKMNDGSSAIVLAGGGNNTNVCLLYTSPSPRDP